MLSFFITKGSTGNIVGGIPLERPTVYPKSDDHTTFSYGAKFTDQAFGHDTLANIIMHFSYESIYYAQIGDPKLKGKIIRKYKVYPIRHSIQEVR